MNKEEVKDLKDKRLLIAARQQGQAADPQKSIWVEASAGTGKTRVLSDRVLRLLLQGVNPSRILCLTYTKAAAVEMNARISKCLANWAVIKDADLIEELQKLTIKTTNRNFPKLMQRARILFALMLDVPGGIKIQTIHSFCQDILKRFPLEAGVSPYFSVMDDRMAAEAVAAAQKELILKIENEPDFPAAQQAAYLTQQVKEFKFNELMSKIAENRTILSHILEQYPDMPSFLKALQNKLSLDKICTPEEAIKDFENSRDIPFLKTIAQALSHGAPTDQKRAENLYNQCLNFDYDTYKPIFVTKGNEFYSEGKLATNGAVKFDSEIRLKVMQEAERILALEEKLTRLSLYHATSALMQIAGALTNAYQNFKRKNALLDYEDLIVITRRLLENQNVADWVLFKLDGGISHVLIDEAQDTSPNQWAIVKALTAEFFSGAGQSEETRTVFAVGDRKQSIYSFQGADPEAFDEMSAYFAKVGGQNFEKVRLDVSFRSTAAVLETVNNLFALPEAKSGVVIDNQEVSHLPYRLGSEGLVELWELLEPEEDDAQDVWYPPVEVETKTAPHTKLAEKIAQKIHQMVQSGEKLRSQDRPLQYSDFMVLVQRRAGFVEDFVRACKQIGVGVAGADRLKLSEQIAVQDLLSLGHFLLLPTDDLSLAEVLKSPLFNLDDDDLIKLCYNRGNASLWQRLRADASYQQVADKLSDLLTKADILRPFDLYQEVLGTLNGRRNFVSRLGEEAEDALDEFVNLTLQFEQTHEPSLQIFIMWMEEDDVEIKRETDQPDNNAVRIMTVHGSKGLQAPIVILPDTVRLPNIKKESGVLQDGFDMIYFPLESKMYDSNCTRIFEKNKQKAYDEYRRLLYVALTRAEDRLYICGFKGKNNINENSWYQLCENILKKEGKEENKKWIFKCPQVVDVKKEEKEEKKIIKEEIPAWLTQEAAAESALSRPYTPSQPDREDDTPAASPLAEEGNFYRRGTLIHRLLQLLPWNADNNTKARLMEKYLEQNASDLTPASRAQIQKELMTLFENPDLSFIFGANAQAEVPIIGRVGEKIVSAQIDRLVILEDKAVIIDFKTNRPAAQNEKDVPEVYKNQMAAYKQLVEKIYPHLPVETYILWTNTGKLMKMN